MSQNQHVRDFLKLATPIAEQVERVFGVPSPVTLAVSALETGWGRHVRGNNYFGIKGEGQEFETHEYIDGERVQMVDSFRSYASLEDSFLDFGKFLHRNPRYAIALEFSHNPERFVKEMHSAGYATDSEWANKVILIMRRWDLGKGLYNDLPKGHWAEEAIREVTQRGIMSGYPDGSFEPNNPVTRAEMAVIISRLQGGK